MFSLSYQSAAVQAVTLGGMAGFALASPRLSRRRARAKVRALRAASLPYSPLVRIGRMPAQYPGRPHDGEALDWTGVEARPGLGLTPMQGFPGGPFGRMSDAARQTYRETHPRLAVDASEYRAPRHAMGPPVSFGYASPIPTAAALRRDAMQRGIGRMASFASVAAHAWGSREPSVWERDRRTALDATRQTARLAAEIVGSAPAEPSRASHTRQRDPGEITYRALRAVRTRECADRTYITYRMVDVGRRRLDAPQALSSPPSQSTALRRAAWPDRGASRTPDKRPRITREMPKPLSSADRVAREEARKRRLEWLSMSDATRRSTVLRRARENLAKASGAIVRGASDKADGVFPAYIGSHSDLARAVTHGSRTLRRMLSDAKVAGIDPLRDPAIVARLRAFSLRGRRRGKRSRR